MAPPAGFSMPPPRPSSSTGHNGGSYHRNYEAKMISPSHHHSSDSRLLVKSSPMSDHAESPSERLAQSNYFVRVFNQVPNERKSQTCTNLEYGIFFQWRKIWFLSIQDIFLIFCNSSNFLDFFKRFLPFIKIILVRRNFAFFPYFAIWRNFCNIASGTSKYVNVRIC